jgi:hypothetical protein
LGVVSACLPEGCWRRLEPATLHYESSCCWFDRQRADRGAVQALETQESLDRRRYSGIGRDPSPHVVAWTGRKSLLRATPGRGGSLERTQEVVSYAEPCAGPGWRAWTGSAPSGGIDGGPVWVPQDSGAQRPLTVGLAVRALDAPLAVSATRSRTCARCAARRGPARRHLRARPRRHAVRRRLPVVAPARQPLEHRRRLATEPHPAAAHRARFTGPLAASVPLQPSSRTPAHTVTY